MKLSSRQLAAAWHQALTSTPTDQWNTISERMLEYLYKRGELRRLREVIRLMSELEHEHHRTTGVTVRSATTVPSAVLDRVIKKVLPHATPVITLQPDESIIGGIQIETNDQRFDLSLSGHLHQLTHALTS